jgi:hypothetical protein
VARWPTGGAAQTGVAAPRSAVVRFQGAPWVYIQTGDADFTRRALHDATLTGTTWFAPAGFSSGERIVVAGAQVLLSEEQKSLIEQEEAASE